MTTPGKGNYGFGLYVETVNGRTRLWHSGSIDGFSTFIAYYPASNIVSIALGNIEGVVSSNRIVTQLGTLAHGEIVPGISERKAISLPRETLAQYVGTYRNSAEAMLMVTLEGGQLMMERTGSPKTPMFAQSETMFFVQDTEDQLEFVKDAQGKAMTVIRYVPGVDRSRTYSRID
jgi:uncharacterized protein DUF3471